ncbi:MAG: EAL domain-containing protein [Actinomycetota bacterium]|nr:EAL domain-containing protein [Actinomycetota bacterium]
MLSSELPATIDGQGTFQTLNPAWQRVLGWSVEELRGRQAADLIHPDDREQDETILENLSRLGDIGVRIALDDFGAGATSLSYFRSLPLDAVKLDRAFVRDLTRGSEDRAVVAALVSLAEEMDLMVVAEASSPRTSSPSCASWAAATRTGSGPPGRPSRRTSPWMAFPSGPARDWGPVRDPRVHAPDRHPGEDRVSVAVGLLTFCVGGVYLSVGVITLVEMRRNWDRMGFSHFGAAWVVMLFTCGPHYLVHGEHMPLRRAAGRGTRPGGVSVALPSGLGVVPAALGGLPRRAR